MKTKDAIRSMNWTYATVGAFLVGLGGTLAVGYLLRRGRRPTMPRFAGMGAGPTGRNDDARTKLEPNWHEGRDAIEEASWESFPASDPPSF